MSAARWARWRRASARGELVPRRRAARSPGWARVGRRSRSGAQSCRFGPKPQAGAAHSRARRSVATRPAGLDRDAGAAPRRGRRGRSRLRRWARTMPPIRRRRRRCARRRERGELLHRLFERLPAVPPDQRRERGRRLAGAFGRRRRRGASARRWSTTPAAIIDHPEFAALFGPDALAEAPIAAVVAGRRGRVGHGRPAAGRAETDPASPISRPAAAFPQRRTKRRPRICARWPPIALRCESSFPDGRSRRPCSTPPAPVLLPLPPTPCSDAASLRALEQRPAATLHPVQRSSGDYSMATKTVTDACFQQDVLGASGPVLVDFWAEWCGPCKMIGPSLEEISDELGGQGDDRQAQHRRQSRCAGQIWRARHPDDDPVQGRPARRDQGRRRAQERAPGLARRRALSPTGMDLPRVRPYVRTRDGISACPAVPADRRHRRGRRRACAGGGDASNGGRRHRRSSAPHSAARSCHVGNSAQRASLTTRHRLRPSRRRRPRRSTPIAAANKRPARLRHSRSSCSARPDGRHAHS